MLDWFDKEIKKYGGDKAHHVKLTTDFCVSESIKEYIQQILSKLSDGMDMKNILQTSNNTDLKI